MGIRRFFDAFLLIVASLFAGRRGSNPTGRRALGWWEVLHTSFAYPPPIAHFVV